jgi:hypothetical protein
VFKPHWLVVAGAVFFVARAWRVVGGVIIGASAQLLATWLAMGSTVMTEYMTTLQTLPRIGELLEPRPSNTLKGLFTTLVPGDSVAVILYAVAATIVLIAVGRLWRTDAAFDLRASAVVLAMMLISPHAFEYDLLLLAPSFLMLANWIATTPNVQAARAASVLLGAMFFAPVLMGLPAIVRLQFSVTAMAAMLVVIVATSDRTRRAPLAVT